MRLPWWRERDTGVLGLSVDIRVRLVLGEYDVKG